MTRRLDPDRLRELRVRQFLTQWDLAHKSGVPVGTIQRAERGRTYLPYPATLRRLADALGCEVGDLLTKEETKATGP